MPRKPKSRVEPPPEKPDENRPPQVMGWSWPRRPKKNDGQPRDPESKGTALLTKTYDEEVDEAIERANKRLRELGIPPYEEDEDDEGMGVLIGYKRPPKKED